MTISNERKRRHSGSRKPLCTDPLLLNQEFFHSAREIAYAMRVHEATLLRWKSKYGFPAPLIGKGLLTSKTAIADWLSLMASLQREIMKEGDKPSR